MAEVYRIEIPVSVTDTGDTARAVSGLEQLERAQRRAESAGANFERQTDRTSTAVSRWTRNVALAVVGITSFVAVLAAGGRELLAFDSGLRNIQSITQESDASLGRTQQRLIEIAASGKSAGQSLGAMARGLYDINSSGFSGAQAMEILNQANIGASAGLTTTATQAKVLTAALNSYGAGAMTAKRANDVLFQTVNLGVITMDELAQGMGMVLPTAASLGVSIEDLGAAIATMTRRGVDPALTMTSLNQVMMQFLSPSAEAKKLAAELGIELDATALRTRGLQGALADIMPKIQGNAEAAAVLFGDVRALRGMMSLTQDGGALYAEMLAGMGIASTGAGAATRALEQQQKAIAYQWRELVVTGQAVAVQALLPMAREGIGVAAMFTELLRVGTQVIGPITSNEHAMRALTIAVMLLAGRAALGLLLTRFPAIGRGAAEMVAWMQIAASGAAGLTYAVQSLGAALMRLAPIAALIGGMEIWRWLKSGWDNDLAGSTQEALNAAQAGAQADAARLKATEEQARRLALWKTTQTLGNVNEAGDVGIGRRIAEFALLGWAGSGMADDERQKNVAAARQQVAAQLRAQNITLAEAQRLLQGDQEMLQRVGIEYAKTGQLAEFAGGQIGQFGFALNMINAGAQNQLSDAFANAVPPAQQLLERVQGIVEYLRQATPPSLGELEAAARLEELKLRELQIRQGGVTAGEQAELRRVLAGIRDEQGFVDEMAQGRRAKDARGAATAKRLEDGGINVFLPPGLVQVALRTDEDIDGLAGQVAAVVRTAAKNVPVAPAGAP